MHRLQACAHTPYEFGVKTSVAVTAREGLVEGMRSMPGNPYDGHTVDSQIERIGILTGKTPKIALVDRGYCGDPDLPGEAKDRGRVPFDRLCAGAGLPDEMLAPLFQPLRPGGPTVPACIFGSAAAWWNAMATTSAGANRVDGPSGAVFNLSLRVGG